MRVKTLDDLLDDLEQSLKSVARGLDSLDDNETVEAESDKFSDIEQSLRDMENTLEDARYTLKKVTEALC